MALREIVQIVEIDIDQCTRTFGVAPCLATLSVDTPRKCYNSYQTCAFKSAYAKGVNTLKFVSASYPIKEGTFIPALINVSGRDQEVNIAGFTPNLGGLGQRASVNITLADFPYNDVLTDKYWAQRISGAAQIDEPGYDPRARGSFWTKFKARNPNYAGRALRVIDAHYNAVGGVVYDRTRHYIIEEFEGPGDQGEVRIVAKDILKLADDEKALAPVQNNGKLAADIDDDDTTATLTPAGIGNLEYQASGFVVIGSEIIGFTRVGDVMTLNRGLKGTERSSHSVNDSVQVCYNVNNVRADVVIRDLLVNYAQIPASYIPTAQWAAEFDRWGSKLLLNATICKPTGVTELLEEISQLGITIWWDELARLIRIRLNHINEEPAVSVNDRNNIISIKSVDNDDERATRIAFWTVQIDPTKALSKDNFKRGYIQAYVDGETDFLYGKSTTKTVYCRWLNQGADAVAKIVSGRLLNRYKRAPVTYTVTLDAKDDINLVDVVALSSENAVTDDTGKAIEKVTQVFYREDDFPNGTITLKLQSFQFDGRYGYITENSRPSYTASTTAQRNRGAYFVGPSLTFSDGKGPYLFV